jgi:putative hydrolase of the HAD superfamily
MEIKAIVFDCGGVLLANGDLAAYYEWGRRLGLTPEDLRERLWKGEPWTLAEVGQISDTEFWRRIGAQFEIHDPAEVARMREEFWQTWVVDEKVLALAERARLKYRVAMLSNSTDALEELLEQRYGVAERFDPILNSARLGLAKPDPAIYQEMLRRLELKAGEVVFIDDRAENVTAAAALGIHVAWFVNATELERQLEPYLR